jgi:hypothetical protein
MAEKRKRMAVDEVVSPTARLTDPPAIHALFAEFGEQWDEEKWTRFFSAVSVEDAEALRGHLAKKKLQQVSLAVLKRLPAYQQLAELETRITEVFHHAKVKMEEELFKHFAKGKHFRSDAVVELLDKCSPPPGVVAPPLFLGGPFGSPFGPVVPPPPSGSGAGSSSGLPYAFPPGGFHFGSAAPPVEIPGPITDVETACALELAMASAAEPSDDEDL